MKIKESTAKKIATELVEEQIICGLININDNIDGEYTNKQHEAIMEQVKKVSLRALRKIDSDWKNYTVDHIV